MTLTPHQTQMKASAGRGERPCAGAGLHWPTSETVKFKSGGISPSGAAVLRRSHLLGDGVSAEPSLYSEPSEFACKHVAQLPHVVASFSSVTLNTRETDREGAVSVQKAAGVFQNV